MPSLPSSSPAPGFDDPFGMLIACHARMRQQLGTLTRLQRYTTQNGVDADARAAAGAILRYFDQAAPHHHADEDHSLLPRVLERAPHLARLVEGIGADHQALERHWRKLRPLLSGIAAGRNEALPPALVRTVCEGYATHLEREEARLFPAAQACLDPEAIAAMGREFAARRGADPRAQARRAGA
ncbi:MAG TPA: hemerythrin domain-containing protein [Casimicrobiaceae bacterium]|nr:hemerythrin domain-containing protein [Casimicrobiaceae bacterium]